MTRRLQARAAARIATRCCWGASAPTAARPPTCTSPPRVELVHELLEGITHSDSRLWRTLTTLWFKPGKLTQEFVAGRRDRLSAAVSALPDLEHHFLSAGIVHSYRVSKSCKFDDAFKPASPRQARRRAAGAKSITNCDDFVVAFSSRPAWTPRIQHVCEAVAARQRRATWCMSRSAPRPKRCSSFCRWSPF